MKLANELKTVSEALWEAEKSHPFVTGMSDGTLAAEKFRFYLAQDYLYLVEYAKVFALAVTKSPNVAMMAEWGKLCSDTLNGEMELHRSYCAEFGITPAQLEATEPSQTTIGYTGHLIQVALRGNMADIIAAVLPCQWGYAEIALHLQAAGMPDEPRYRKWIEMYASAEFEAYGQWLREELETLAPQQTPADIERLRGIFHTSTRWEYLFWEMAWKQEMWNLPE